MKELEITDDCGTGKLLLCENHFKKYLSKISRASENQVAIIIRNTIQRGCVQCSHKKSGASPWCGTMFKIWRGLQRWERGNEKNEPQ
jgi:hypothetical protein